VHIPWLLTTLNDNDEISREKANYLNYLHTLQPNCKYIPKGRDMTIASLTDQQLQSIHRPLHSPVLARLVLCSRRVPQTPPGNMYKPRCQLPSISFLFQTITH